MEIGLTKRVPVIIKELRIHMKVCDSFCAGLFDAEGEEVKDYEGYVPSFMPGEHYGDYVILNIDIDTGQITNWKEVTAAQVQKFIDGKEEE